MNLLSECIIKNRHKDFYLRFYSKGKKIYVEKNLSGEAIECSEIKGVSVQSLYNSRVHVESVFLNTMNNFDKSFTFTVISDTRVQNRRINPNEVLVNGEAHKYIKYAESEIIIDAVELELCKLRSK